jgi:type IV pilus assembly protein PilM
MSAWSRIARLVTDPPPAYVFEFSEAGVAFSRHGASGFEPFPARTLVASPLDDNIQNADAAASAIARIAPPNGAKKRPAAVILPDLAARVSVLDFDSFPSSPEEQMALVRFRVKKTVPFDIDSAAVSFAVQPPSGDGKKKADVVAVTVSLDILARYEALIRNAHLQPGEVTTSALAALNLYNGEGIAVIAKLAGRKLTVMVASEGRLKLFRCLALEEASDEEILGVLYPTFAYVEDELGQPLRTLLTCGFPRVPDGLPVAVEPLRGRIGTPGAFNAGLLGYLEGAQG